MKKLKGLPTELLKEDYQKFIELANSIHQKEGKVAYVERKTLRESAEKSLRIYKLYEKLKKLNF